MIEDVVFGIVIAFMCVFSAAVSLIFRWVVKNFSEEVRDLEEEISAVRNRVIKLEEKSN